MHGKSEAGEIPSQSLVYIDYNVVLCDVALQQDKSDRSVGV